MSVERLMPAIVPMLGVTEAMGALGAALRMQRDGTAAAPELAARLDAVLERLGVREAIGELDADEATGLLGFVEGFLAQAIDFVRNPGRDGWDHGESSILLAQGHMSGLMASPLKRFVVPHVGGDLAARLDADGAAFLDVGVGVGALSVAMCRQWPSLRVVGLDPWDRPLALARETVAQAGMEERIELRQEAAEALTDEDAFDLAWVPTFFVSGAALESVIAHVLPALKPGGWALLGLYARPEDPFAAALADLRTVRHGGATHSPQEVAALMTDAGFEDVDVLWEAEWRLPIVFAAGRRASAP
jgi:2-polyprenyl-3-methyl-5-hydroxy-6-metoxy-1,4-benzoquinol methylase